MMMAELDGWMDNVRMWMFLSMPERLTMASRKNNNNNLLEEVFG